MKETTIKRMCKLQVGESFLLGSATFTVYEIKERRILYKNRRSIGDCGNENNRWVEVVIPVNKINENGSYIFWRNVQKYKGLNW